MTVWQTDLLTDWLVDMWQKLISATNTQSDIEIDVFVYNKNFSCLRKTGKGPGLLGHTRGDIV